MNIFLKSIVFKLLTLSLSKSNRERKESALKNELSKIVPDLSDQYSTFKINMDDSYTVNKVRCQHTFQMSLALKAIKLLNKKSETLHIVDIGDSSGTHLIYLEKLLTEENTHNVQALSVNLDPIAIEKIKAKGLKAVLCKAEELHLQSDGIKADIFLSYEMLEHLFDPISFMHNMAEESQCEYFIITVPYVKNSRVALQFVKYSLEGKYQAENTHVFELSPEDWDTIFKFSGWEIVYSDKYTQYPKSFPLCLTKYLWQKLDFDGFYGVILQKNNTYSTRYLDW